MNIFYISSNPIEAARWMIDKHIVKMPTESAQMLSTAHRILDGQFVHYDYVNELGKPRKKKMWILPGECIEVITTTVLEIVKRKPIYVHERGFSLYSPTHITHPSSVWTMMGRAQYEWHYKLTRAMLDEYTRRYGKKHGVERVMPLLKSVPKNIPENVAWSDPPLAMPDKYKSKNHVESYRQFYVGEKSSFARWKNCEPPAWFKPGDHQIEDLL